MTDSGLSNYKFELADSYDLSGLGELTQARNRSLQLSLNRAGAFSCTLPLDDGMAEIVEEVRTCVIVSVDGETIWSGPVWNVQEQINNQSATMQIGCVGWLQTLDKRVVRPEWNAGNPIQYDGVDAGEIALDLLTRTNNDAYAAGAPSYVFPGIYDSTQFRYRTYQPWSGILTSLNELTEIESGFDMLVDPVTRELNIYARIGVDSGILFQLPGNVSSVSRQTDSGSITNYITAYSSAARASEADAESLSDYGLFEEAQSLSDVVNSETLTAWAAGEIFVHSRPLPIISFQPQPESPENPNAPRVFRDYNIGDFVRLTARKGRLQLDRQPLRIFSFTVSFPETGGAQVSDFQTAAGGA